MRTVAVASLALALASSGLAQTEVPLVDISQTGIGSNGFGTSWRGQDVELAEDAWLTRIVFETGSATGQVDEVRLMTAVPSAVTLRAVTALTTSSTEVTAVLAQPFLLRGATRYTIWFHQSGSPRGTYGCDLTRVDPTWRAYHTNVDPTQAPGTGEPGYFWGYQYGTNVQLVGYDNLEITGALTVGGAATFTLEARPNDLAAILFATAPADLALGGFAGALRLDPLRIVPAAFLGGVGPSGTWINTLAIPNDPNLHGLVLFAQGVYDATFASGGTLSPLDWLRLP